MIPFGQIFGSWVFLVPFWPIFSYPSTNTDLWATDLDMEDMSLPMRMNLRVT